MCLFPYICVRANNRYIYLYNRFFINECNFKWHLSHTVRFSKLNCKSINIYEEITSYFFVSLIESFFFNYRLQFDYKFNVITFYCLINTRLQKHDKVSPRVLHALRWTDPYANVYVITVYTLCNVYTVYTV